MILVPGPGTAAVSAAGRSPSSASAPAIRRWLTPAAAQALAEATDLVGYGPYVDRVPARAGPAPPRLRQPRRAGARAPRARRSPPQGAASRWSRAAIPASSPWRRRCSRRSRRRARPGAPRHRGRARHHRDAGGGGAGRRAARRRFLRHLAVRQPEALGGDRAAPARRRSRPISSSRSTTRSRRPGPGSSARPSSSPRAARGPRDAGRVRARRRAAGRGHRRSCTLAEAERPRPTWRRWSSSARARRGCIARPGGAPPGSTRRAALRARGMSLEPGQRRVDVVDASAPPGFCGRATMTTGRPSVARGGDLAVGRRAAGVLGHHDLDRRRARISARSSASSNGPRAWMTMTLGTGSSVADRARWCGRCRGAAAPPRRPAARAGRRSGTRGAAPSPSAAAASAMAATSVQRSPGCRPPGRPAQGEQRHAGLRAGRGGIARDLRGERMRGVDHGLDALARAASAPAPPRRRSRRRGSGRAAAAGSPCARRATASASKLAAPARRARQRGGFRRAAENQDAHAGLVH